MTEKEKAKAYDKAIERAKKFYGNGITEEIFPELKESDDEKIRRWIIDDIRYNMNNEPLNNSEYKKKAEKAIAWLEKQESYYTFEIKEGHWYKCVCDYMLNGSDLMFKNDNLYYCRSNWRLRGEIDEQNVKDIGVNGYKSFFRPATNQEIKDWLEKQGKQTPSQTNERAWLYLVSDVLTWKDGIGQYLDDPRVQELAKRLCSEYAQKLYNPSNSSNTGKNEQKSADKIKPRFKVGDWVVRGDTIAQILDIQEQYYVGLDINGKDFVSSRFLNDDKIHLWTLQDAKDGNVLSFYSEYKGKKMFQIGIIEKYVGKIGICSNTFKTYVGMDWDSNLHIGRYMGCDDIQPSTKEQRDALMKAINDDEYEWDIEKKELKKKRKR